MPENETTQQRKFVNSFTSRGVFISFYYSPSSVQYLRIVNPFFYVCVLYTITSRDFFPFYSKIKKSSWISTIFGKAAQYKTVTLQSEGLSSGMEKACGFSATGLYYSDIYLRPPSSWQSDMFVGMFIDTRTVWVIYDRISMYILRKNRKPKIFVVSWRPTRLP